MAESGAVTANYQRAPRDGKSGLSCEDCDVRVSIRAGSFRKIRRKRATCRAGINPRSGVCQGTSSARVFSWIAMALSLCALAPAAPAVEPAPRSLQAQPTAAAPVIDGVLDEACWRGAPGLEGFRTDGEPASLHSEQSAGWICYDEQHLYIGVRCQVSDVAAYRQRLAEDPRSLQSGIRLQIDWRNARQNNLYEEYILNLNGSTGYLFNPGTGRGRKVRPIDELKIDTLIVASMGFYSTLRTDYIESGVSFTDDSYLIEAAIPFAIMHLSPRTAKTWALNVQRIHDVDLAKEADKVAARSFWSTSSTDPKRFGALTLDSDFSRFHWGLKFVPPQPGDRAIEVQLDNATGKAFAGALEVKVTRRAPDSHSHRPDGETFVYRQPVDLQPGNQADLEIEHACGAADSEARYQFSLWDTAGRAVVLGSTSRRDLTPGDDWAPPAPIDSEESAGYLVYRRPYTIPMTYRSVPKREEMISDLDLAGCRGEFVPITFALYPLEDLPALRVGISDLIGPQGRVIPSAAVDIRYVTHHALWQEKWIAYSFKAQENLLRNFDSLVLTQGRCRRFWLTVKVPEGEPAGTYTGAVTLTTRQGETQIPLRLTVLPFALAGVEDLGYFMYANGSLSEDPEKARKVAQDMRDHGMTTATVSYFAEIGHRTGDLRLVVDEPAGYSPETGWIVDKRRPMTYAKVIDILVKAGFAQKVPLIEMYAGGMGAGYKPELVAELDRIYQERHWPDVLYYVWDEFDASDETARRARQRFSTLQKHGLGHLKYTTALTARPEMRKRTDALAPRYDVWILGTPAPDLLLKGRAMGKQLWSYGWSYSHSYTTADLRHYFGRYLWKSGLQGASLWCYNHGRFRGRFWSYIDRTQVAFSPTEHKLMFSYVWEEDGEIIPTARWEAIREGIDDYRYLRTLKQFSAAAATADQETLRNAGRAGLQLLDKICDEAPAVVSEAKVAEQDKPSLANIGAERRRVAAAIVRIQKAAGLVTDVFDVPDR